MQIHELTYKKKPEQVDEGIASSIGGAVGKGIGAVKKAGTAIASPFRDVASGYRSGKVDAKTSAIADKAYRAWSAYRQQLDKAAPGGKADSATLQKQLLAFVQKNLLGQKQLSTLINKNQILGVVNQIAGQPTTTQKPTQQPAAQPAKQPTQAATQITTKPRTGGKVAGQLSQTPGAIKKREQRATAKSQSPGAQAFSQMATQLQKPSTTVATTQPAATTPATQPAGVRAGKVPSTPAGEPVSIGGQKLNPKDPAQAELIKKAQAAAVAKPIQEAASQELELFKKLVSLAAQAEQEVDPNAPAIPQAPVATAPQQQKLTGKAAKSTGNPAADQLLTKSGYKVQA